MALRQLVSRWAAVEQEALPLWLPVALGAGILAWFALPWSGQRLGLGLGLAGLGLAALLLRARWPAALLLVAALGLGVAEWRSARVAHEVLAGRRLAVFSADVEAVIRRPARGDVRLVLAPRPAMEGLPGRVRLSVRGAAADRLSRLDGLGPGARVQVRAMLMPPAGPAVPGGHDMARALWFEGIGATGVVLGAVTLERAAPPPAGLRARAAGWRAALALRLTNAIPGDAGAVAAVFVTGDRGTVPLATAEAVRAAGLAHLLSISGLHMAVVVGGVILLVRRLLALWPALALRAPVKTLAFLAGAAAGLVYTLLAGGAVPTVRALLATLIVLVGLMAGREAFSLRLLAAAAFLILLVRPEVLMGPSFQMSFAAVAAIIALYEVPAVKAWIGPAEREAGWLARSGKGMAALLATGLVAEAVLSPIGLFHFHQTGTYGVGANLLAIPLTSFGIIPALGLGLLGQALGLGDGALAPAGVMIGWLLDIARATAALPGAVARLPAMPGPAFALMVVGGLWLLLWRSRLRLAGLPLLVAGAVMALAAPPADLLVSRDGRHVALRLEDGRLAMLRPRAGAFIRDVWGAALAGDGWGVRLEDVPGMACSRDACVGVVKGRRLFATRSSQWLEHKDMETACAAADIVVSDRRLPDWCRPRWLRLGRLELATRGAVAIWLVQGRAVGARDGVGDHPWREHSGWQ